MLSLGMDLREYLNRLDQEEKGWVSTQALLTSLQREPINLTSFLNEQEIATLVRAFSSSTSLSTTLPPPSADRNSDKPYYHHELCDVLSKRFYLHSVRGGEENYPRERSAQPWTTSTPLSSSSTLSRYLTELRSRRVMWRRSV
jgi:hypothetical protein